MKSRAITWPTMVQAFAFSLLGLAACLSVLPALAVVLGSVVKGARSLTWSYITSIEGGLLPAIVGTTCLVLLTTAITAPVGIAAAVYLSEYARPGRLLSLVRFAIVNLAGIPSVVYGLFGLALFVQLMGFGRSLIAGSCTLALLVLPLVIAASEEALRQVPARLREASFALGATRWQTVRRVVLPNALPGILTGLILAIGRAAGETAPILFTAAFYSLTNPFPRSVGDKILALPYQLYVMATEAPDVTEEAKWATATVLVALVLTLNIGAIVFRARLQRVRRW